MVSALTGLLLPAFTSAQTVTLELPTTVLSEGADTAAFVRRSRGPGSTRVRLRTEDGSPSLPAFAAATGGTDYSVTDLELVLGDGDVEFVIIETFDDDRPEPSEVFEVVVEVLSGGTISGPDRVSVEIIDDSEPPEQGLELSIEDRPTEPGSPDLPYEVAVTNHAQLPATVTLTAAVPVSTLFRAADSTPGWSCDPGPYEGSRCEIPLGALGPGETRRVDFAVRLRADTPAGYEPLAAIGFARTDAAAGSAARFTEPSHGSCSLRKRVRSTAGCELRITTGDAQHPVACVVDSYKTFILKCCVDDVMNGGCFNTCDVTCNLPCSELRLLDFSDD